MSQEASEAREVIILEELRIASIDIILQCTSLHYIYITYAVNYLDSIGAEVLDMGSYKNSVC